MKQHILIVLLCAVMLLAACAKTAHALRHGRFSRIKRLHFQKNGSIMKQNIP